MYTTVELPAHRPAARGPRPPRRGTPLRRSGLGLLGLCLAAGSMAVIAQVIAHEDITRDRFQGVELIEVEVETGTVELVAAEDGTTTVTTSRHWAYKAPSTDDERDGSRLSLVAGCPDVERLSVVGVCEVDYQIAVPDGMRVEVTTEAGTVTGTDLRASRVDARSSAGDVRLAFATAPRAVTARSSAGDVRVSVPFGPYDVETDTSAGDVDVDVVDDPRATRLIDARSSAGDITVSP